MGKDSGETSLRNLMLYSYVDNCGLSPSEVIAAISTYKYTKSKSPQIDKVSTENPQLELPLTNTKEDKT